jgi:cytochrome P450
MAQVWNIWKAGYRPFEEVGSDTFILASHAGNMLWTCDPNVMKNLLMQHAKSQIPVDMVKFYDIYGPTIGSTEGDEWRTHRRVITAGFNPATYNLAWKESLHQTGTLTDRWIEEGSVIPVVKKWTSLLTLHVISGAFFHKSLEWKDYTQYTMPTPPGHQISYEEALFTVLKRLGYIFLTHRALLGKLPGKGFKEAALAFTQWTKYMQELREQTAARIEEVAAKKNKSVLESIVVAGTPGPTQPDVRALPEEGVLGDIWFTLFAGHETTGNTTAFILLLLTLYPDYQKKVQKQLDEQLGDRPKSEWTVEQDVQALQKGWVGAVQKEVLRCYNVVQWMPRYTVAPTTLVDSKGRSYTVPEKTLCCLDFSAAFRNPNTWPVWEISEERKRELHDSPAAVEFDPERWLRGDNIAESKEGDFLVHYPFGQGPRSCPGRGFAQIEMTGIMATIFKDYSLELVVGEKMIEECNGDEETAWQKTRDNAFRRLFDDITSNFTIEMQKDIPIKIVKRKA